MARMFDVISPDEERQARRRRLWISVAVVISLAVFYYPHIRQYQGRWRALAAARALSAYLQELKTQSILSKKAVEVRFVYPATLEVYSLASCGVSTGRVKEAARELTEFTAGLEFLKAEQVQALGEPGESTTLNRFCYDPINGSSLAADGVLHGNIYLGLKESGSEEYAIVKLIFVGANGDVEIE